MVNSERVLSPFLPLEQLFLLGFVFWNVNLGWVTHWDTKFIFICFTVIGLEQFLQQCLRLFPALNSPLSLTYVNFSDYTNETPANKVAVVKHMALIQVSLALSSELLLHTMNELQSNKNIHHNSLSAAQRALLLLLLQDLGFHGATFCL